MSMRVGISADSVPDPLRIKAFDATGLPIDPDACSRRSTASRPIRFRAAQRRASQWRSAVPSRRADHDRLVRSGRFPVHAAAPASESAAANRSGRRRRRSPAPPAAGDTRHRRLRIRRAWRADVRGQQRTARHDRCGRTRDDRDTRPPRCLPARQARRYDHRRFRTRHVSAAASARLPRLVPPKPEPPQSPDALHRRQSDHAAHRRREVPARAVPDVPRDLQGHRPDRARGHLRPLRGCRERAAGRRQPRQAAADERLDRGAHPASRPARAHRRAEDTGHGARRAAAVRGADRQDPLRRCAGATGAGRHRRVDRRPAQVVDRLGGQRAAARRVDRTAPIGFRRRLPRRRPARARHASQRRPVRHHRALPRRGGQFTRVRKHHRTVRDPCRVRA